MVNYLDKQRVIGFHYRELHTHVREQVCTYASSSTRSVLMKHIEQQNLGRSRQYNADADAAISHVLLRLGVTFCEIREAHVCAYMHVCTHSASNIYMRDIVSYMCDVFVYMRDISVVVVTVGPNAGEVTQGFAAGFVGNLTFNEWNLVIGIHPTVIRLCYSNFLSMFLTNF